VPIIFNKVIASKKSHRLLGKYSIINITQGKLNGLD